MRIISPTSMPLVSLVLNMQSDLVIWLHFEPLTYLSGGLPCRLAASDFLHAALLKN
jgi:hypothetical protein